MPTRELPDALVRLAALFSPTIKAAAVGLGDRPAVTNEKARRGLGFTFRSAEEAIVAMAESLIDFGAVQTPR